MNTVLNVGLPLVAALLGAGLLFRVVRYMRMDRETRASIRQAMRVRLGSITLGRARRIPALALTDFIRTRLEQDAA